jgi:phage baseplate assembly protein W
MSSQLYNRISLPAIPKKPELVAPKTYRGFSTLDPDTDHFGLYDFDLIKRDISNHFHIRQGERLMQPSFGTIIWDLLFEPLTEQVKSLILQDVNRIINYDPRVSIADTNISSYESGLQIVFSLTYNPYNITEQIKMRFDQSNGLVTQ